MATVNNWLGFSLSPQELPSSAAAAAGDVSGADVCFNIPQGTDTYMYTQLINQKGIKRVNTEV